VEITWDHPNQCLYISQHQYILNILDHFNFPDCKPVTTPMEPGLQLTTAMCPQTDTECEEIKIIPYLSAVDTLMYLATSTCHDIAYTVGVPTQTLGLQHWNVVKHLLSQRHLILDPSSSELITTFSDADFGGNKDAGQSTSGYMVHFGTGAISWQSKLQPFVVLSTTCSVYLCG
jgi:hypothetical protein